MDISSLQNISSSYIKDAASRNTKTDNTEFDSILKSALNVVNETNNLAQDADNEEIKLSMGLSDNTHDLTIAQEKATTALQYTIAVRDRFMEAYKEIMQIQI